MSIGFAIPYERSDATTMCCQIGQMALDLGLDAWIYPTTKGGNISTFWDRRVINASKVTFENWLESGIDQLYYVVPPSKDEIKRVRGHTKAKLNLLLMWEYLHKDELDSLRAFDRVVSPCNAVTKFFTKFYQLLNVYTVPWDSGVPITFESRELDPRRIGVMWCLEDSQYARQDVTCLSAINTLLETCPEAWLTMTYSKALPTATVRELRKLAQFADGRVELLHNLNPLKQELLYGRHDLTLWPVTVDSAGLLGLTSLAMGTPVIAYDYPTVGEIIRTDRNGHLVACEIDEDEDTFIPRAKPDHPQFGKQLVELVRNTERLASLRSASIVGLRERREEFRARWKKLLLE